MGIKPLRSISSGNQFENNDHQRSQIIHFSDMQDSSPFGSGNIHNKSQIVYQSRQKVQQLYVQKQQTQYHSGQQLQTLNQYIFFMKNNTSNMDLSNLYLPIQVRVHSRGICEQVQKTQLYYPVYEYRMRAQLDVRRNRNQLFNQTQIWYLIMSVLNAMRQYERIKCVSIQFEMDNIRFNSQGCVKVKNMMTSPKIMQRSRNQRIYWSHKNMVNYYIQQTYRLAIVILQICTYLPITQLYQQSKIKQNNNNNNMLYNMNINQYSTGTNNLQNEISRGLYLVQQRYSQLLYNLLSVMLCHQRDRPLPSQIYQVFSAYKDDIMQFKPFNFSQSMMAMIKNSVMNSRMTHSADRDNRDRANMGNMNNMGNMGNSMGNMSMYNSYGDINKFNNHTTPITITNNNNNMSNSIGMYNSNKYPSQLHLQQHLITNKNNRHNNNTVLYDNQQYQYQQQQLMQLSPYSNYPHINNINTNINTRTDTSINSINNNNNNRYKNINKVIQYNNTNTNNNRQYTRQRNNSNTHYANNNNINSNNSRTIYNNDIYNRSKTVAKNTNNNRQLYNNSNMNNSNGNMSINNINNSINKGYNTHNSAMYNSYGNMSMSKNAFTNNRYGGSGDMYNSYGSLNNNNNSMMNYSMTQPQQPRYQTSYLQN